MDDGIYYLYGMPASLYTAKARSYMRKQRIDHVERAVGHPHYQQDIMATIGRLIMPVLETPSGELVQDTVDIIDHLEATVPGVRSVYPTTPVQRCVAHVLELFGGEGLLRPAMHYRWNFDDENIPFISQDFAGAMILGGDTEQRAAIFAMASDRMRSAAEIFGVTPETVPIIEESYAEFLSLMAAHLESSPYLLGGRPSIGDFGFMGPLYAHLARDPVPARLMKRDYWRVWRWVERMNAPVFDAPEYGDVAEEYFDGDEIPETLRALLRYISEEFVLEITEQTRWLDAWLAEADDVETGGVVGGKPARRTPGSVTYEWRGTTITTGVFPYRLYVLQRLQDAFAELGSDDQSDIRALFSDLGLETLLDLRARRRVDRVDNREVWGAEQLPQL
jgi:glutathione S-transferase